MKKQNKDIRWHQRLENYKKALKQLDAAVKLSQKRELSQLEEQGLIQSFEYTFELAWNLLKDYLYYLGIIAPKGHRDVIRESFNKELIEDGEGWMNLLLDRNKTSHSYNEETSREIVLLIKNKYLKHFLDLEQKMESLKVNEYK